MKHIFRFLALLLLMLLPFGVFAQQKSKNVVLPADQTVNGTYFGTGGDVRLDGTVNGDAYLAGGTVTVNGRINGDLLVAGGTVTVSGAVTQNIRVAGGTVTLAGQVGRNVTVGGGTVILERGAGVQGSVVAGAGTLSIRGPVQRDLIAGGGSVSLENAVGGNVQIDAGNISLTSGAKVAGDLSYMSTNDALIEKGASVSGRLDHRSPTPGQTQHARQSAISGFLWGKLISFAALYMFGLLFINFLPRFTTNVVSIVKRDIWKSVGLGILILLLTPALVIFLIATIVGIPFAFALLFGYIIVLYIGKVFVAMYLGEWASGALKRKNDKPAWTLFVGLVIHMLLTLIPVLGWIAGVFMMLWGTGALAFGKKEAYHSLRKKDLL